MQSNETLDQFEAKSQLQISEFVLDFLRNTQGFARFLGIAGYVFTALFVFISFYLMSLPTPAYMRSSFTYSSIGLFYLLLSAINFFVAHFCFLFGLHLHRALQNKDTLFLENAFKNLMYLFRIIGVSTIVVLVIYAFVMVASLVK
jgi:hypothetical protein